MNTERQKRELYILVPGWLNATCILYDAYVCYTALFGGGTKPSCSPSFCLQFWLLLVNPTKLCLCHIISRNSSKLLEVLQNDQANVLVFLHLKFPSLRQQ